MKIENESYVVSHVLSNPSQFLTLSWIRLVSWAILLLLVTNGHSRPLVIHHGKWGMGSLTNESVSPPQNDEFPPSPQLCTMPVRMSKHRPAMWKPCRCCAARMQSTAMPLTGSSTCSTSATDRVPFLLSQYSLVKTKTIYCSVLYPCCSSYH